MDKTLLKCRYIFAYTVIALFLRPTAIASGQDRMTVKGVVSDESGLPIIRASLLVKNAVNGVSN